MTKLEKMIENLCTKDCDIDLEYDPKDGHYHVDPPPPDFFSDFSYSDHPAEIYWNDASFNINELIQLRDWLNVVLEEA